MPSGDTSVLPASRFPEAPRMAPPLDPGFRPVRLARRAIEAAARASSGVEARLAVEQPNGSVYSHTMAVFPDVHRDAEAGYAGCERLLKSLLW